MIIYGEIRHLRGGQSFAVTTILMHDILTTLTYHSFSIVKTSFFCFVSGSKIDSKESKNFVKIIAKNCSLGECYGIKNS